MPVGIRGIQPGELRERVTIQRDIGAQSPDGRGGYPANWQDVATVAARVEPVSTGERLQAMALEASQDYRITIRYRDTLTAADRIVWRSQPLQILGPPQNLDLKREYQELICRSVVAT